MLPFEQWWKQIREWVHNGDWEKVKLSARKRIQAKARLRGKEGRVNR